MCRISLLLREDFIGDELPNLGAGALLGLVFNRLLLFGEADNGRLVDDAGVNEPVSLGLKSLSALIKASLYSRLFSRPS